MKINDIVQILNKFAPLPLQESFDNCGLIVGNREEDAKGVLLCIDITERVVEEAIRMGFNMIVSHHPLIFRPLKSLTVSNYVERCLLLAIKNDIAIYAGHTNFDNASNGVSWRLAQKLGLKNIQVLVPKNNCYSKIISFVPNYYIDKVSIAAFESGAGHIGSYDCCSFASEGQGSFRALEGTNPFVGKIGELHRENEVRLEFITPNYIVDNLIFNIKKSHPYEEPAIDIIPLSNVSSSEGLGVFGTLEEPLAEEDFLKTVKEICKIPVVRHSRICGKKISRVALCGGSGGDFIGNAKRCNADIYLTSDLHHHHFFSSEDGMLIADIGHFESEQFVKEIFYEEITKKFPNFAVRFSEEDNSVISYL